MSPPSYEEWIQIVNSLPNNNASGPSGVSNEMLKHLGPVASRALWKLACLCLVLSDIPQQWKEATIYPIPKPIDWEYDLTKTRPITLLECARKAVVKLISTRLSLTLAHNKVLKGHNHAGLPGSSTMAPLRIINSIVEDAKENKKSLWILFQDLSKAYDRVNTFMLDKAMARIQIPANCRQFIGNLFTNRSNSVIGHYGLSQHYDVLIGGPRTSSIELITDFLPKLTQFAFFLFFVFCNYLSIQ